jgi:hypothetical protein
MGGKSLKEKIIGTIARFILSAYLIFFLLNMFMIIYIPWILFAIPFAVLFLAGILFFIFMDFFQ